jgi:hypothetical protein
MGPEEKAKVWKEFMSSPLAQEVYNTYYHDKYHGNEEEEDLKKLSIESIVHTSEMMNLLVHGYEARTLAEKPKEESQMGPKGDPQWLDEPNHPKDGSATWYWVKVTAETKPSPMLVYWGANNKWIAKDTNISSHWDGSKWLPNGAIFPLAGRKVAPIQEPS